MNTTRYVNPDEAVYLDGRLLEQVISVDLSAGEATLVAVNWRDNLPIYGADGEYETLTVRGQIELRPKVEPRPIKERVADGSLKASEPEKPIANPFNPYGTPFFTTGRVIGEPQPLKFADLQALAREQLGDREPLRGASADFCWVDEEPVELSLVPIRLPEGTAFTVKVTLDAADYAVPPYDPARWTAFREARRSLQLERTYRGPYRLTWDDTPLPGDYRLLGYMIDQDPPGSLVVCCQDWEAEDAPFEIWVANPGIRERWAPGGDGLLTFETGGNMGLGYVDHWMRHEGLDWTH